jgi:hypothetical protein
VTLSLLTMVPTRWRRENCERLLKSFTETTDSADLVFITDADDDSYMDMDLGPATNAVLDTGHTRVGTTVKVNNVAAVAVDEYDALMYIGDDHLFSTEHWDTILLGKLEDKMGGTGMIYGDDKRRTDIPEMIIITSDIVRALGHFAEPSLSHYYIDNVWAEMGSRADLLRFCPDVVFEHLHYQVNPDVEHDQTYSSAETLWGTSDQQAFQEWRSSVMPMQVSVLRREFHPDVKWVRGKI